MFSFAIWELSVIKLLEPMVSSAWISASNLYGLLFWNYERNTFITPKEVNAWLRRLNTKYKITDKLHIDVSEEFAFKQLEKAI